MANEHKAYEQPYTYGGESLYPGGEQSQGKEEQKIAVALSYDPKDMAPRVVAAGKGAIAHRIIDSAKESQVPTYKDQSLAGTLMQLEVGDLIPPELYGVVAEILVYVDGMDKIMEKM